MIEVTKLRKGQIVVIDGDLWLITDTLHVTKGNLRGFVRLTMRNTKTGQTLDQKFASSDQLEVAHMDYRELEYSYKDDTSYVFMNTETYDQITLPHSMVPADDAKWLVEGQTYKIVFYEGRPVSLELTNNITLEVVETEPYIKGQTAAKSSKPAKLANGVTIGVPPFISAGDKIKVNPQTREYIERAS